MCSVASNMSCVVLFFFIFSSFSFSHSLFVSPRFLEGNKFRGRIVKKKKLGEVGVGHEKSGS